MPKKLDAGTLQERSIIFHLSYVYIGIITISPISLLHLKICQLYMFE